MFYFMSKGDFKRIAVVVELINTKNYLLSDKDSKKILGWVNESNHEYFDQFCLAVSDEWSDCYPKVALDDYVAIANIISDVLKEW